jgi:hypothetical protein
MLEQIKLADIFVHYDDVQFSKGSFTNRVQIKHADGETSWMTIPLSNFRLGQQINEVTIQNPSVWTSKHLNLLRNSFVNAPYAKDALNLAEQVLSLPFTTIAEISRASMLALAHYYDLSHSTSFIDSATLNIYGSSTQRVVDIVKTLGGTRYISGRGGLHYLNHNLFEVNGIGVAYMEYKCKPYPQGHGAFTPYVSGLDLVAHTGQAGIDYIVSEAVNWRDLLVT